MIDAQFHARRRAALRRRLSDAGLDALLVAKMVNVRYLSGFTGSSGSLLVAVDEDLDAFATDGRYLERAADEVPGLPRLDRRGLEWVGERLPEGARLGLESGDLPWQRALDLAAVLQQLNIVPAPDHVEALRTVKDQVELGRIAAACAATDRAFADLLTWLAPGMTERDVARRLEAALLDAGADTPAFPALVASGPNAVRPHHAPGERTLAAGDLVILDFGAAVAGYTSDMTRTVALGEPAKRLRDLYDLVAAAQRAGVRAVADGVAAGAVDAACRDVIAAGGHGDEFLHPSGHGLGLEIHEEPVLRNSSTAKLAASMAVTVEPGVYVRGLGGVRIEDTVLVVAGPDASAEVLTRTPKDLLVL